MTREPEPGQLCQRCKSPIEASDLRCALCALPVPHEGALVDEAVALVLRCHTCGAAVSYEVEVEAPRCAFCGDVADLAVTPDPLEEADEYLPFLVDEARARRALDAWIRQLGFLRPASLSREATLDTLTPVWWVGWTFEVEATVSWTADSNQGRQRSRWAPHAGQRSLTMRDVLVSASRGLSQGETRELFPGFDLATGRARPEAAATDGGTDPVIERFDVPRSTARALIVDAMVERVQARARRWVPGGRVRKLRTAVLPRKLYTRRRAFPTYVLAYRYRDRVYRALVHGQRADQVVGQAPYSWLRIGALALVVAAILILLVWGLAPG